MPHDVPYRHGVCKGKCASRALRAANFGWQYVPMEKHRHFIKEWRVHKRLTQEQFAERVGISRAYLSKIESGKRRYDQPFLEAAADILSCEPADLIMRNPTDPAGLWSIYDQLTETQRVQLVAIGETLRKTG